MKDNKIINLISNSSSDMLDLTLESIESIRTSCCVVIGKKVGIKNLTFLKKINNEIIFEEDLTTKRGIHLWNEIHKLFNIKKKISYLIQNGDGYLDQESKEREFFLNNNIDVNNLINVYNFINIMNKEQLFLTDREKNSSVVFLIYKSGMTIFEELKKGRFGKMIIKFDNEQKQLIKLIEKLKNCKKYFFYLIFDNKLRNVNSVALGSLQEELNDNKSSYLIIEDNDKI